jgi:hypothetical protein
LKPSGLWVNHLRVASPAGSVDITSGWTPVLLRYDSVGRGFVVFRDAGRDRGQAGTIPLAASWYGDPSILQYDLSPHAAGRTEKFRCTTPPGLKALTFAARTQPKVWIDGIAVPAVRQTPDALRFPDRSVAVWHCELQEPRIEPAVVALEFVHEPGIAGGAVLPEPLRFDCASGTMALGDLSTVESLRTYSGGMIYRRRFRLPAAPKASGKVMLDLGGLVSSAEVRVNGQSAGIHSSPPWTFDVTRLVREGDNTVEVEVYNTLANYYLTTPTPFAGPTTSGLVGPVRILYSR